MEQGSAGVNRCPRDDLGSAANANARTKRIFRDVSRIFLFSSRERFHYLSNHNTDWFSGEFRTCFLSFFPPLATFLLLRVVLRRRTDAGGGAAASAIRF